LAFDLVSNGSEGRQEAIAMLDSNFESGDHATAMAWFGQETDRFVLHRMGIDLRHLWEDHPEPLSEVRMLTSLYERGPCSSCREFLLARLIELGAFTVAMRVECAWDANDGIRVLVK
jgi:hypothetical protein